MSNQLIEKENAPVSQTAITPAQMIQTALDKGAPLEQLDKLMDLQERWEKNEARREYTQAMSRFRADCPSIKKTKKAHNSKYAGLAETIAQIKSLLAENGLSHSWKTNQDGDLISVTCCVTHVRGHQECTTLTAAPDTSGSKNSIQAIGSTVAYLERYTLFSILGLASSDDDLDGNSPESCISVKQAEQLRKEASVVLDEKQIKRLLNHYGAEDFEYIKAHHYNSVVQSIEGKKGKK